MTPIEQLAAWVSGDPQHNPDTDECCPDFSCCNGGKIVDLETRKRFQRAFIENDEKTTHLMLMGFLGNAFPNTYIAGYEVEGEG